jgi:hypothetical protein
MSRYQVNKALREIILDRKVFEDYKKDPAAFLTGRDFTAEEREAFLKLDYKTLYGLGVHPFLLNGFVIRVWPGDRADLFKQYNKMIAPLGRPDFST